MSMADEPTVANGYPLGRPDSREHDALDAVIRRAIEELPMETRLYPDVYAWRVTDAVKRARERATTPNDVIRRIQAEALRKVAAQMDEFVGTILNPAGCAAIARAEAERIERGETA